MCVLWDIQKMAEATVIFLFPLLVAIHSCVCLVSQENRQVSMTS